MPWVRFDDQFTIHRKVDGLSDTAFRLHVAAIFWCARNLTDGFLPEEDLDLVCARVRAPGRFAAECVKRRAWHAADENCPSEKCPAPVDNPQPGWVIHDYLEYQPSAAQVARDREAKAARQKRWLENKAKRTGDASQSRKRRNRDASRDASKDVAPPRPAPKEAGRAGPAPSANGRASPTGSPVRAGKPDWCGHCDEKTRLTGEPPRRCPDCHPLTLIAGTP